MKVNHNNRIPGLTPALKKELTRLAQRMHRLVNAGKDTIVINDALKKLGFTERDVSSTNAVSVRTIFVHKQKNLVVKFNSYTCDRKPPRSCPTFTVRVVDHYGEMHYGEMKLIVQPLVDTTSKKARVAIEKHADKRMVEREVLPGFTDDAHSKNVGLYNGKLVQFDW